jgi:RND superfamily putative drug exporter
VPTVVVDEREGGLRPTDLARARADVAAVADLPGLRGRPSPPLPSRDGEALQVFVPVDGADGDSVISQVEAVRATLDRHGAPDGLDVHVTGVGRLSATCSRSSRPSTRPCCSPRSSSSS